MGGVALLATVLGILVGAAGIHPGPGAIAAFRTVFLVDAGVALLGVAAGLAIRDEDAASTMRGGPGRAAAAEAQVDEQARRAGADERGVAPRPAGQHRELHRHVGHGPSWDGRAGGSPPGVESRRDRLNPVRRPGRSSPESRSGR